MTTCCAIYPLRALRYSGTLWRLPIWSPNVLAGGAGASLFRHGRMTAGTPHSDMPYILSCAAALALIGLILSFRGPLCQFVGSASQKWWKYHFRSIEHDSLRGLCCYARCSTLPVMDNMEASCIFYVKAGMFAHLEYSKISLWTINESAIIMLPVQYDMIFGVIFM
jgi:hypothetical protein